jgi:hypothetical protein
VCVCVCVCVCACVCVWARTWGRPCHIYAGDRAHADTSAKRLATTPLPHLQGPQRCHTCIGSVLRVAFLASVGALAFRVSFEPAHVTQVCRRSMVNQRRRVWSIIHTVVDFYRCHDGTATVLQFDWAGQSDGIYQAVPPRHPTYQATSSTTLLPDRVVVTNVLSVSG